MSHFCVLVVTPERPTDEVVGKVMQPYHEYECTGKDDEYVQDVDITDKARKEYLEEKRTMLRDSQGVLWRPYEDRFYREPTPQEEKTIGPLAGSGCGGGISWSSKDWGDGRGYRAKVRFVPSGYEEIETYTKDHESFADWIEGYYGLKRRTEQPNSTHDADYKYGYVLVDSKGDVIRAIDRTNPNKKWDYWRIGGRYAGKLQAKNPFDAEKEELSWEWKDTKPEDRPNGYDICQRSNLDAEAMKEAAVARRRNWVLECCDNAKVGWDQMDKGCQLSLEAHEKWMQLEEPKPRGAEYHAWCEANGYELVVKISKNNFEIPEPAKGQSLTDWVESAPWLSSFAILKDGVWSENGRMGWWGAVHDEKENWDSICQKLISEIPDDHWLAVCDCHI